MATTSLSLPSSVIVDTTVNSTSNDIIVVDTNGKLGKNTVTVGGGQVYIITLYTDLANSASLNRLKQYLTPNTLVRDSTNPSSGISAAAILDPVAIDRGTNIVSALITISDASIVSNNAVSYPVYCWVALFRVEYLNRFCIGFIEFNITTPVGAGLAVGRNSTFSTGGLLGTHLGTTDGIYEATRFLIPNNNITTPSFTVSTTIPIGNALYIGAETIYPSNASGNAVATVNTISTPGSATSSSISYNTALAYNRFVGLYRGTALTLRIT